MTVYRTTEDAWKGLVRSILEDGTEVPGVRDVLSVGSWFGKKPRSTREVIVTGLGIEDIRSRIFRSVTRPFRLGFAFAQMVWALSGSDKVDGLSFYQPRGTLFSDDGVTIRSAIGRRIFRDKFGNQFQEALNKLRKDPTTRRALIQIYCSEDLFVSSRDISCTGSLQLFIRDGSLHAICHMRSQSALVVLPYDLFTMTMFHEFASVAIGCKPGVYWHLCNSSHIYSDELESANTLINEQNYEALQMPPMQSLDSYEIETLVRAEEEIRAKLRNDINCHIDSGIYGLCEYWHGLLNALVVDTKLRHGCERAQINDYDIPEVYKKCLLENPA